MKRQSVLLIDGFLGAACSPSSPVLPDPQTLPPDLASMPPAPDLGSEPMIPAPTKLSADAGLLGGSGTADDVGADA